MALRRKSTAATKPVVAVARIRRKENSRFPRVNYSVPDDSKYEVHDGKLHAILTTTPRGLVLAWDNCGACLAHIRVCKCSGGITLPLSIGYLYSKEGGLLPPKPVHVVEDRPFFMPKPRARRNVEPNRFPQFQVPVMPDKPKRSLRRKGEGPPKPYPVLAELKAPVEKRRLRRKAA